MKFGVLDRVLRAQVDVEDLFALVFTVLVKVANSVIIRVVSRNRILHMMSRRVPLSAISRVSWIPAEKGSTLIIVARSSWVALLEQGDGNCT